MFRQQDSRYYTATDRGHTARGGDPKRKSKFIPEQILQALRQAEAGTVVGEICRKLGVTEATFYRWKKTYSGLDLGELRELRQLREENRRLKHVVADLTLDKAILREAVGKKWWAQPSVARRWSGREERSA